jgi:DDE superfamily endonuclease
MGRLRSCFTRTQTWLQSGKYVSALASDLPARNGWSVAEHAGDRTPDRSHRLLNRACWDETAAMSQVRKYAAAGLDAAARRPRRQRMAAGALDETGQEKQGSATAGVKRQYTGCAGRVANGINTVHLPCVREKTGHALAGARQRVPAEDIAGPVKSLAAALPLDLRFRTKGQLAIDVLACTYADGLSFDFACGDEAAAGRLRVPGCLFCGYPRQLHPRADSQFAEDMPQVKGHGMRAEEHLARDFTVAEPLRHQVGDPALTFGQAGPAERRPVGVLPVPDPDAQAAQARLDPGHPVRGPEPFVPLVGLPQSGLGVVAAALVRPAVPGVFQCPGPGLPGGVPPGCLFEDVRVLLE